MTTPVSADVTERYLRAKGWTKRGAWWVNPDHSRSVCLQYVAHEGVGALTPRELIEIGICVAVDHLQRRGTPPGTHADRVQVVAEGELLALVGLTLEAWDATKGPA